MPLTVFNALVNLLYYGVTVGFLPWIVLWIEDYWGVPRVSHPVLLGMAALAGWTGAGLQWWCIVLFQRRGRGTPSPVRPPQKLVIAGPYRWVRNPINLGELMVFVALAAWFGSLGLLVYAALALLAFDIFVRRWEEPALQRQFGQAYDDYRQRVRRWMPKGPQRS